VVSAGENSLSRPHAASGNREMCKVGDQQPIVKRFFAVNADAVPARTIHRVLVLGVNTEVDFVVHILGQTR